MAQKVSEETSEKRNNKRELALARRVLQIEEEAIRATRRSLSQDFTKAIHILRSVRGRVIVVGIGKSGLIGRKLAATLTSTGTNSIFMHPAEALHGDLGLVGAPDAILALSFSGESEELRTLIPYLKNLGVPVVALTGAKRSRLARLSEVTLTVKVPQEACPFNITPTASTTAMLALGDALAVGLMRAKNFKKEDFARLHPGGALGRRLNLKAQDIMRRGASNPVIKETGSVRDALLVMTQTRSGAVNIVDQKGRLSGFFTDGDLRRQLNQNGHHHMLARKIGAVMTRNPCTVSPDTPMDELIALFKDRSFDNVPVVNAKGRPVGLIDERDLL